MIGSESRAGDSAAAAVAPSGFSTALWKLDLENFVRLAGHRNWVVIADAAYPVQAGQGIHTISAPAPHLCVVEEVLAILAQSKHIRPTVYLDRELTYLRDEDAPGISVHREELRGLIPSGEAIVLPHDEIIAKLDRAGRKFRALVIKTPLLLPYTSVFLELDCGYWSQKAEQNLRARMSRDNSI